MRTNKLVGGAVSMVGIIYIFFLLLYACSWFVNIYKLAQCDFNAPYKAEVMHTAGIFIPAASMITVWVEDGK